MIIADMMFWAVLGIPITFTTLLFVYDINSSDFTQVILIKQALNGLLSVSLATMLRAFIPYTWYYSQISANPPKLSKRIFELCLISIAIPSLIVMLVLSDNSADKLEKQLLNELDIRAEHLRERAENYQLFHRKAVESLADTLQKNSSGDSEHELMSRWVERYPGFITMILTNHQGVVINGVPSQSFEKLLQRPPSDRKVNDRDYFKVARDSGQPFVSDVFRGRGFGNDPIIAVSVPIIRDNTFYGIVEGSLNLPKFETIDNLGGMDSLLVVDSSEQVIYGSHDLQLAPLDTVTIEENSQSYSNAIKSLTLNNDKVYNYKTVETSNGWHIYILSPFDELLVAYRNSFYALLIGIMVVSLIASRIAHKFSQHITRPLERLVTYFSSNKIVPAKPASYFSSQEIETVRSQLQQAQRVMIDFQEQLKAKVDSKTEELVVLNAELEKLSSHDPLTGLLNRRGFEQVVDTVFPLACRNQSNVTLAIMDLDHFKHINDKFGHNAGDACLITVAQTIEEVLQRDSDYVGRFGGEEFVALIIGESVEQHSHLLQSVRRMIEELTVEYEGDDIQFTISIGAYSLTNQFDMNYDKMLCTADKLLYESKESGRNRMTHKSQ
ncbi:sensor domain-containing diguanylate cyclase [Kangiella geojedonensis]|uniref:sensor domain-containing diguanylate cyclase n=1 Tax=Kangiella geojedonensis TaxID=914150 RepID=UPI001470034B|nr:diguanylate cyclase [Kangiella geojedonensis]